MADQDPLEAAVAATIRRHGMFLPGTRVGVGVSGGPDSVCLLHALSRLAEALSVELVVLHLNHQLRGKAADEDADFVRAAAAKLGLACHTALADVAGLADGANLEQAARNARREFFRNAMAAHGLSRVAVGHTQDDQAETVVFRLARGAGPGGLRGILPVTREGIVRPLLDVKRSGVVEYLERHGLSWRDDLSNLDPNFTRNRIRHQLLPLLTSQLNPALTAVLARTAAIAYEEERYWEQVVRRHMARLGKWRGNALILNTGELLALSAAEARRLLRKSIEDVKGDLRDVTFEHVEQILSLFRQIQGSGRLRIPEIDVFRSFDWVRIAPIAAAPARRNWGAPLLIPGEIVLPDGSMLRVISAADGSSQPAPGEEVLYFTSLPDHLEVRGWRPGDRYHAAGDSRPRALKEMFQQARIPLWERRDWPIMIWAGEIVWTRRFGASARHSVAASGTIGINVLEVVECEKRRGC